MIVFALSPLIVFCMFAGWVIVRHGSEPAADGPYVPVMCLSAVVAIVAFVVLMIVLMGSPS